MTLWDQEWLVVEEAGTRRVPAFEWLKAQPLNVRKQLLAILIAVRSTGPDNWHDPGTHRPMKGPVDHVHEARDKSNPSVISMMADRGSILGVFTEFFTELSGNLPGCRAREL